MTYGPYDAETKEPAGYYDFYSVEFEMDGIKYQLLFDQMELTDVISVTASVICGNEYEVRLDD